MKFALLFLFSLSALAKPITKVEKVLPYLGPGSEKLSAEEYKRIYKNYIQTSILLGYSIADEPAKACEQSLNTIFRQVGMYSYPVPTEAEQIRRSLKQIKSSKAETYELSGVIVQVVRDAKSNALDYVILVNSSSPKAIRKLSQIVRNDIMSLEKDPITGLERVKGVPVGFPHPLLSAEGQGLYVKILKYNKSLDHCEPQNFIDNTWVASFDLSEARCTQLQTDVMQVWREKMSPDELSSRELARMKEMALKNAVAQGSHPEDAKKIIEKQFTAPFTNPVNIVGSAMRNLAQCNLLALGRGAGAKSGAAGSVGGSENDSAKGAGSAK